jgi:hypothetical protein
MGGKGGRWYFKERRMDERRKVNKRKEGFHKGTWTY